MTTIADVLSGREQWAVVEADCADVQPMLPDGSVDHVLTDPPYEAEAHTLQRRIFNGGADRGGGIKAAPLLFGPLTPAMRNLMAREWARICSGWILAFCQIEAVALWRASLRRSGIRWARGQVWRKPNGQPQMTGDRPGTGFECIATGFAGVGRMAWNGGGRHGFYEHAVDANFSKERRVHPTQKPLSLMLELVELFTNPGELVLDPFCGSGSLGIACVRLGRRYLGMDNGRDENGKPWAQWAREGIAAEGRGLSRGAARAGQLGLFA